MVRFVLYTEHLFTKIRYKWYARRQNGATGGAARGAVIAIDAFNRRSALHTNTFATLIKTPISHRNATVRSMGHSTKRNVHTTSKDSIHYTRYTLTTHVGVIQNTRDVHDAAEGCRISERAVRGP